MPVVADYPPLVFLVAFAAMGVAVLLGDAMRRRRPRPSEGERDDFGVVLGATLTLLGLIVGFSFSMAVARYDQRKVLEEGEANAIGTAQARADFLPADQAAEVKRVLTAYAGQRVAFYTTRDSRDLAAIAAETKASQDTLWRAARDFAAERPTPVAALFAAGINDVINAQGYTLAAWRNRLPVGAWILMLAIAVFCNVMIAFGAHRTSRTLMLVLPLTVSLAFFLIADIDSPRGGVIRVAPQNLLDLAQAPLAQP